MQLLFYLVAFLGSGYFLLRIRRFDFFTIGFASCLLYFLPGFFGYVRSARDFTVPEPLLPETYAVFVIVLVAVLAGAAIYDHLSSELPAVNRRVIPLTLTTEVAFGIAMLGLAATVFFYGDVLLSSQKSDILESIGRWHILFRFAAIFAVVFAVVRRQIWMAFAAFSLLLFDLYVGFRFGLVIALIGTATVVLNRRGPQSLLRTERGNIVLGILVVGAVMIYKKIYIFVKMGLWDKVAERLTDPVVLQSAILNSEPFTTQSILNEIIAADLHTGAAHLTSLANLLVPFATMLGAESHTFNNLFQQQLFAGAFAGGMANNIWAEMYAIGGWLGILIAAPVFAALLAWGSSLLRSSQGAGLVLVIVLFSVIAFYFHRNDLGFELTLLRRCLVIWVVTALPAMALVDIASFRRSASGRAPLAA